MSQLRINKNGRISRLGALINGSEYGGDTGTSSKQLYYCGLKMNQCRCGHCDGTCGPANGCPCHACVELVGHKVNLKTWNNYGKLAKLGSSIDSIGIGISGIKCNTIYYCGNTVAKCYCGTCDGKCGPTKGCPCEDCITLLPDLQVTKLRFVLANKSLKCIFKDRYFSILSKLSSSLLNSVGGSTIAGVPGGNGGDTGMDSGDLRYCNEQKNECRCGQCDGNCGPTSGCPCNACLELVFNSILNGNLPATSSRTVSTEFVVPRSSGSTATTPGKGSIATAVNIGPVSTSSAPHKEGTSDNDLCTVCMEMKRNMALVPCGHYTYCENCVALLSECAICRAKIEKFIKVFH